MKNAIYFALAITLLSFAARADDHLTAVGARDKSGAPTGEFRIVDATGDTLARGNFAKGKMDGVWMFFELTHVKVEEVTYAGGARTGTYRTFFGSHFDPHAAGKVESQGQLLNGRITGRFTSYDPDGNVNDDVTFAAGAMVNVKKGDGDQAKKLVAADLRFIDMLEEMVREAVK